MRIGSLLAVYFVVWWIMLFMVLPFGVRSQAEAGTVVPGSEPGAPVAPKLWQKALWTSLIAAVVTAILYWFGDALLEG
ncbi:MAG: DUF1467 family protein [Beijerinckiaceae bacterium]